MNTLKLLSPLLGAVSAALGISALVRYADAWSDMQSKVGASVKNTDAAPALMQRIVAIANASYSPLQQTAEIYFRNVGVLRDLGLNADKAADFTEFLNNMLVITATRGERAASVQPASLARASRQQVLLLSFRMWASRPRWGCFDPRPCARGDPAQRASG